MNSADSQYQYCSECGAALSVHKIEGLVRVRASCSRCNIEYHAHPQVLLTGFVSCGEKLLWIRRALEPRRGYWAIPGGFRELGESLVEGAARELQEETGIFLTPDQLQFYMMGSITYINQIYVAFRAAVTSEQCFPGSEAIEVGFFSRKDFPWDEVAYPEANMSILQAYSDLESGKFNVYHGEMSADKNLFSEVRN